MEQPKQTTDTLPKFDPEESLGSDRQREHNRTGIRLSVPERDVAIGQTASRTSGIDSGDSRDTTVSVSERPSR